MNDDIDDDTYEVENTSIASVIAKVAGAIGSLSPDKKHQQGYPYISADLVLQKAGIEMANHGLAIVPAIVSVDVKEGLSASGKTRYDAYVNMYMVVMDSVGNNIKLPWFAMGSDSSFPDKALAKAITTGDKYFKMKIFNVGIGNEEGGHDVEDDKPSSKKIKNETPKVNPLTSLKQQVELALTELSVSIAEDVPSSDEDQTLLRKTLENMYEKSGTSKVKLIKALFRKTKPVELTKRECLALIKAVKADENGVVTKTTKDWMIELVSNIVD